MPPIALKKIQATTNETCKGRHLKKGKLSKNPGIIYCSALRLPKKTPPNSAINASEINNIPISFFIYLSIDLLCHRT